MTLEESRKSKASDVVVFRRQLVYGINNQILPMYRGIDVIQQVDGGFDASAILRNDEIHDGDGS